LIHFFWALRHSLNGIVNKVVDEKQLPNVLVLSLTVAKVDSIGLVVPNMPAVFDRKVEM
jgi:hypothetical protein